MFLFEGDEFVSEEMGKMEISKHSISRDFDKEAMLAEQAHRLQAAGHTPSLEQQVWRILPSFSAVLHLEIAHWHGLSKPSPFCATLMLFITIQS